MRYIIDFKNSTTQQEIDAYLETLSATVVKTFSAFEKVYIITTVLVPPSTDIIDHIIVDDIGTAITPNNLDTIDFNSDNEDDWWKTAIVLKPDLNSPNQTYLRKGENAIVYLLDSGVKTDLNEFSGLNIETLYSFNNDPNDYNGHGTALASVIVGNTCGITKSTLKSVKIFQNGLTTHLSHLLYALDAVSTSMMNSTDKMHVLNISWSVPKNLYLESKIQSLINVGLVVVTSAGNDGSPIQDVTPASMASVITVGAFNQDLEPCDFSNYTGAITTTNGLVNYGDIDVWAPGIFIKTITIQGNYGYVGGTSIASAIQSAAIAFNSFKSLIDDNPYLDLNLRRTMIWNFSSDRINILNLTGLYQNSVNRITTIRTIEDAQKGVNYGKPGRIQIINLGSKPHQLMLNNGIWFKDIEILDPLPEGITFTGYYILVDKPVTELFEFNSKVKYTTFTEHQYTVDMSIKLFPDTMLDDPELQISLTAGGCSPTPLGPGPNPLYECFGNFCFSGCYDCNNFGPTKFPLSMYCICPPLEVCP